MNQTDIHHIGELKQWLIQVWCSLDWDVIDTDGVKDFESVFVLFQAHLMNSQKVTIYDLFYDCLNSP